MPQRNRLANEILVFGDGEVRLDPSLDDAFLVDLSRNRRWLSGLCGLIPATMSPAWLISRCRSRIEHTSRVQPGVKSAG
jgi:hypothetical protein